MPKYVFGPITSRRLGTSLGVNNIPYKTCSYSCVYCQLGRTTNLTVERRSFYFWKEIVDEVIEVVRGLSNVDYVTFVPDGEPLLDENLGLEIKGIKERVNKPVAVLSNGSLLYLEDCRSGLISADLVSVKVDATSEEVWRRVNRPHPELRLDDVLEGIKEFSQEFRGRLITETMLVKDINTKTEELVAIAEFIKKLKPFKAYVAIPIRPPAEPFVKIPEPEVVVKAYDTFVRILGQDLVELLNLPEPPPATAYGNPISWLLSVVSVHPLRHDYALSILSSVFKSPEEIIVKLESEGLIKIIDYSGIKFIVRWFRS